MQRDFDEEAQKAARTLTLWQKTLAEALGAKLYIGHEQREGWSGKLPFYLFCCESCRNWAKDYPHGHAEEQHLNCPSCGMYHEFNPVRAKLSKWCNDIFSHFEKG